MVDSSALTPAAAAWFHAAAPEPGEIHLFSIAPQSTETTRSRALHWLSGEERDRAASYGTAVLGGAFVVRRGVLRRILAAYLGMTPGEVEIGHGLYGKPSLSIRHGSGIRFSLAHSGDRVLVAIAAGAEVGVDLEIVKPVESVEALGEVIWTESERREFLSVVVDRRLEAFYLGWVRKEAALKAFGRGLSDGAKVVEVPLHRDAVQPARLGPAGSSREVPLLTFTVADTYLGAIAVGGEPVRRLRWMTLLPDLVCRECPAVDALPLASGPQILIPSQGWLHLAQ